MIVFQSAGNDYGEIPKDRQSENTIIVGALEESRMKKARYSNYGEGLDIMGFTDIYIENINGKEYVVTVSDGIGHFSTYDSDESMEKPMYSFEILGYTVFTDLQ